MNLKLHFYQGYYQNLDLRKFLTKGERDKIEVRNKTGIEQANKKLFNAVKIDEPDFFSLLKAQWADKERFQQILLETTYPGLLLGTGYNHETGNIGEIKIGFHFDHTTGLPVIPGHSVKGVLRSVFPKYRWRRSVEDLQAKTGDVHQEARAYFMADLLGYGKTWEEGTDEEKMQLRNRIHQLELGLFERVDVSESFRLNKIVYLAQKDWFVCFDAHLKASDHARAVLAPDVITPHGDNPLRNPIPLPFVKVPPGEQFVFSFLLPDLVFPEEMAPDLFAVFQSILLVQGVGAKTNVGYGRLKTPLPARPSKSKENEEQVGVKENSLPIPTTKSTPESTIPTQYHYKKPLREGQDLVGKVVKNKKDQNVLLIVVDGIAEKRPCAGIENFELNTLVKAKNTAAKYGNLSELLTDPQPLENPEIKR